MGKYEPLADHLKKLSNDSWDASFGEIEDVLGFKLPTSAHAHRAWWANQYGGNHSQAKGWIEAGWETREIDQPRGRVRFERMKHKGSQLLGAAEQELWQQAMKISGINDRAELERAAVSALIEREAARALARMGGTMADAQSAPRSRPFE